MENLENEMKRTIWERQSGMCALTGKKFEDFSDLSEADFISVKEGGSQTEENIVMVWKLQELPKGNLHRYHFPYANFSSYSDEDKAEEIKSEIMIAVDLSNTSEDWRETRSLIKDLTTTLNSIGIPISYKNELRDLLRTALENVDKRQSEEAAKNKEIWQKNYEMLKEKIVEAVEFSKTAEIFKEAREKLIAVQNEYKEHKVSHEHKNELEKLLHDAFEDLSQRQAVYHENFEMECIENYYKLKTVVSNAIEKADEAENFASARNTLIDAQKQLRDKVLKRDQKDELFAEIRNKFDELREKFNEVRLTDEEIEANYQQVQEVVSEAVEFAENATQEQAMDARQKLIDAQGVIKEYRLPYSQKNELFAQIRKVFERINEMLAEEREQFEAEALNNFSKMLAKIDVIIVEIENAIDFNQSAENLATVKAELRLLKLKREQRDKLFDRTRVAFSLLSKMREKYNKRRVEERTGKLDAKISNLEQKNARLSSLLAKDKEILAEQTEKLNNAENEQDKESAKQIVDIVNARIAEREESLKITTKRINDIKIEIEKIIKRENERKKARKKNKTDENKAKESKPTNAVSETEAPVEQKETETPVEQKEAEAPEEQEKIEAPTAQDETPAAEQQVDNSNV